MLAPWRSSANTVARDVIAAAEKESAVLGLSNTIVMPAGVMNVPVVSVAPTAVFVATGARKPSTTIEWSHEALSPEEIALTTRSRTPTSPSRAHARARDGTGRGPLRHELRHVWIRASSARARWT